MREPDRAGAAAEREPNADLARALDDTARRDAVDPDDRQQQPEARKKREYRSSETAAARATNGETPKRSSRSRAAAIGSTDQTARLIAPAASSGSPAVRTTRLIGDSVALF